MLEGVHVVIVADRDEVGRKHARDVAASVAEHAASVRVVESARGKDAADHLAAGLKVTDFLPVSDQLVSSRVETGGPPPNLAEALDAVREFVTRHVVVTGEQADAIALWVAHCWNFDHSDTTPYLAISSPERRAGKSRLLDVLELLVPKPWRAVNPSEAVVFRKIEADEPTMLLDEVDAIFGKKAREHEGLRALLNADIAAKARPSRAVWAMARRCELSTSRHSAPRRWPESGSCPTRSLTAPYPSR